MWRLIMSISRIVKERVNTLPEGSVISFSYFGDLDNLQAVALCLSRLKKSGVLEKLEKGKYYIPKKTKFGTLGPSDNLILNELLNSQSGVDSYISGVAAYNALGLTTQIPNEVTIVGRKYSRKAQIGKLKVKYVKGKAPVTKATVFLLQILDALNDIKKIPDTNINDSMKKLKEIILTLQITQKKNLIKLSQYYRPSVQALAGAVLEEDGLKEAMSLKEKLNPLTKFKLNISKEILPLQESWNLK
jgi:hypothetical protein